MAENLKKEYEGVTVVDQVSFNVEKGESVGIVGESGCGKSTTARLISGLEKPDRGQILVQGEPYRLRPGKRRRCKINMVFQDPADSFDSRMTVFACLYEALSHTRKISRREAVPVIAGALETVELPTEYAGRRVSQLSGGECQRVAIARAVLTEPELLICDEATSALDVSVQAQMIQLLQTLKREKKFSFLFISHDLALVSCMCTRVLVMYRGRIVEEGSVEMVMKKPCHPYTRLLVACGAAFTLDEWGNTQEMPRLPEKRQEGQGGCGYYPFCRHRMELCRKQVPRLQSCGDGHRVACYL